jgi:hypothetical protein
MHMLCRYRELQETFARLQAGPGGAIPVMALTATATLRVRHDIVKVLGLGKSGMGKYHEQLNTFHRENLYFAVHHSRTKSLTSLEADLGKYLALPSSHSAPHKPKPSEKIIINPSSLSTLKIQGAIAREAQQAHEYSNKHPEPSSQYQKTSETSGFPAVASIKCPLCETELQFPVGASPDQVVGAHLDAACAAPAVLPSAWHEQGSGTKGRAPGNASSNGSAYHANPDKSKGRYSVYLLYWHKGTNTDAAAAGGLLSWNLAEYSASSRLSALE